MTTEADSEQRLERPTERMNIRAVRLLAVTGLLLFEDDTIYGMQIHEGHDVHGFYDLRSGGKKRPDNSIALHIQAYPGMSDDKHMSIAARFMDKGLLREIRAKGGISVGNEHEAFIDYLSPDEQSSISSIPWDANILRKLVKKGVSRLK